jgi:hypothetical protein
MCRTVGRALMMDLPTTLEAEISKELVKATVAGLVSLVKKVPNVFRRSGTAKEERVAAEVDRFAANVAAASGPELTRELVRQEASWEVMLRDLVAEYPEAADELRAIAAEVRKATAAHPTALYQQRVDGSSAGAQGPGSTAVVNHNYAPGSPPPQVS